MGLVGVGNRVGVGKGVGLFGGWVGWVYVSGASLEAVACRWCLGLSERYVHLSTADNLEAQPEQAVCPCCISQCVSEWHLVGWDTNGEVSLMLTGCSSASDQ